MSLLVHAMLPLMTDTQSPDMRVQVSITGARAMRVRQVMAINGFSSENECVQYLISRGLESVSPYVRQWEMLREVQERSLASQADFLGTLAQTIDKQTQ